MLIINKRPIDYQKALFDPVYIANGRLYIKYAKTYKL